MAAVVFIDAGLGGAPGTVEVARCGEVDWLRPLGHVADPGALLALTAAVFGRAPEAWLVTVRVSNLDVGDALSATAERAVTAAVEAVRTLVARLGAETASAAGEPAEPALDPDARHRGGSADDHGHD
jgi:Ni,Fe-hydrogenase maturation factor